MVEYSTGIDDFAFSLANEEIMEIATNFVEKYADFVENVPFDLQRQVTRLREIDCTCRENVSEIEGLYASFIKEKDLNLTKRSCNLLIKIQNLLGRCQELGDEKIAIVQQITEIIENKKKAVEHSSHKFKAIFRPDQKTEYNGKRELNKLDYQKSSKRPRRTRPNYNGKHEKVKMTLADPMASTSFSRFSLSGSNNATTSADKPQSSSGLESGVAKSPQIVLKSRDESASARKLEKSERKEASPASSASSGSSVASPSTSANAQKLSVSKQNSFKSNTPTSKLTASSSNSNGANKNTPKGKKKKKKTFKSIEKPSARSPSPQNDLPIDPDEPTYCLCDQVSYGQMIGCDNKKCPIEWFHFSCVGLTHKPKGKWFCPDCSRDRKKEAKKEHR